MVHAAVRATKLYENSRASERAGEILTYNNNIVTGERVMLTPCYLPNARFQESQMETVLKRSSRVMMMSGYWGWSWERQSPNCALPNVWSWAWVHCGCTRDAIFLVSRRDVGPIGCRHRSASTKKLKKILLKWNFFTNEDFLIWKTQVRPSSSGNRISFLGSSTDSHQITTTVKTLQRLIYKHTADSENAQRNRKKKNGKI
jgi:hypothetical protein